MSPSYVKQSGRRDLEKDPNVLTYWGRVTHICVWYLNTIGSGNCLSPERRQAIIWTNVGILLIGPLGTNFNEILIEIQTFSLKKIRLKMSSAKCSLRLGLSVLNNLWILYFGWQNSPEDIEPSRDCVLHFIRRFIARSSGYSHQYIFLMAAIRVFLHEIKISQKRQGSGVDCHYVFLLLIPWLSSLSSR